MFFAILLFCMVIDVSADSCFFKCDCHLPVSDYKSLPRQHWCMRLDYGRVEDKNVTQQTNKQTNKQKKKDQQTISKML